jgi:hypothetical protein
LAVALATFGIRAALLPVHGFPVPSVGDEFSYQLAADTFASGRLSNPVHPLWASFESIQILVKPKYASKYQPGQGLFLALGQKLLGHPFYGVMISASLMNAALSWMLFGWTSRRWALLMSLYPVLFFTANQYWMDSYWGGAVTATGAALTLGSYPRLIRGPRWETAVLFASGLGLLFLTRPYEGGALAVTVVLLLAWRVRRQAIRQRLTRWKILLPMFAILLATVAFQLTLNRSVTGAFLTMPYVLHIRTYQIAPVFWVIPPPPPPQLTAARQVKQQHSEEYIDYRRIHDGLPLSAFVVCGGVLRLIFLLCYPILLFPFLLPAARKDPWLRALLGAALVCFIAVSLESWSFAHYAAPLFIVVFAFLGRSLWKTSRRLSTGRRIALEAAAVALLIGAPLVRHVYVLQRELRGQAPHRSWADSRFAIDNSLIQSGERDVVFVRYSPTHNVDGEWVFNKADIDAAPVIWARDLGQEQNDRVIAYYGKSRRYLLVEADAPVPQVQEYDPRQQR